MVRFPLKRLVPSFVKDSLKPALRAHYLGRALRRVAALPPGKMPDRRLFAKLRFGWGNETFSADVEYLEEVARRAAVCEGPILECGSGLTTLLLGLLARRPGAQVWTLEHHAEWYAHLSEVLAAHRITGVELCHAPLRDYEGFCWYDPPLDRMPECFSLVICDGPPSANTLGGRYGLLPVMGERLSPDGVILLDDVHRPSDAAVLDRWAEETGLKVTMHDRSGGMFATATRARTHSSK